MAERARQAESGRKDVLRKRAEDALGSVDCQPGAPEIQRRGFPHQMFYVFDPRCRIGNDCGEDFWLRALRQSSELLW